MREIVLDTETTGFKFSEGHRMVEIGCVELIDGKPTGRTFHAYFNPERDVPEGAVKVHGLTTEFLQDKPLFVEKALELMTFIGDARLVIHNAEFDMPFLNGELAQAGFPPIAKERVTDTLLMAREKFPGQKATLDSLCEKFGVDTSARVNHGALLDAELLAGVYPKLCDAAPEPRRPAPPKPPVPPASPAKQ